MEFVRGDLREVSCSLLMSALLFIQEPCEGNDVCIDFLVPDRGLDLAVCLVRRHGERKALVEI